VDTMTVSPTEAADRIREMRGAAWLDDPSTKRSRVARMNSSSRAAQKTAATFRTGWRRNVSWPKHQSAQQRSRPHEAPLGEVL